MMMPNNNPFALNGFRVIASPHMTEYDSVKRTWRERLFSIPWRPLKKFKLVESKSKVKYVIDETNRVIYGSPMMIEQLKKQLGATK